MTSRDVIIRNLTQADPARIGLNFDRERRNDFCGLGLGPSRAWRQRRWSEGGMEYYDDEWGNIWYRVEGRSAGGEIYQPALREWGMLKDWRLPDMADPERYSQIPAAVAQNPGQYHMAGLPGFPFAICRYLRKMEVYFQDLILERDHIDELHEKVTALLETIIVQYARAGADGIFFCEDWGTQERLLVSPAMWRDIFKPLYRRLCGKAHENGLHVLMHSCGYNWEILDDLAKAGVNAFQFDQPALYGLERLAEKLQRLKVCLWSPVDIQAIMPTGDRRRIEESAALMARLFRGTHGGFIAKNYGDLVGIGVQPEWDQWAYEAFLEATK